MSESDRRNFVAGVLTAMGAAAASIGKGGPMPARKWSTQL